MNRMTNNPTFAFFGTPYVSRDTLAILAERGYVPTVVITSPARPRGRGMVLTPSETEVWAREHGIPVLTPEKIDETAIQAIAAYGCAYALVVAYGKILPEALITAFPQGVLNIHYSLLPKYRGASPVEAALLNGDTVTGVAIQKMVYQLDAGDVIALQEVPIEPTETTRELRPRLVTIGAEILADILPQYLAGELPGTPQNHEAATKCGKIRKEDGELHLTQNDPENSQLNWNKYRAYAESPGTFFFAERDGNPIRVKIKTATLSNGVFTPDRIVPEGKNEQSFSDFAAK
jgi:methionyl-tRNA formyltransferase